MTLLELLLVEDNEGDVEMTKYALRNSSPPCNISVANDGVEALEFLHRHGTHAQSSTPHLILLDLNMPRMDGKQFLEELKSEPGLKSIPVVMFTSSQSPDDIRACYERYASAYVVKPFDSQEFADTLRQVVAFWGKRAERAHAA